VNDADAWAAVLDVLARPMGRFMASSRSPGGWQAGTIRGGNAFGAEISTVRCVKERSSPMRRLYFLTFEATLPPLGDRRHPYSHLLLLEYDASDGWREAGGAGGGGQLPPRSEPRLNLAGGSGGDHFYAGGRIDRAGLDIDRVRLRFADGSYLDDDAESDVALFLADTAVRLPATVEIYDRAGVQVASHPGFPGN
jgi:hypothetical protein